MAVQATKAEMEVLEEWNHWELAAAKLFANGASRHKVARLLRDRGILTSFELRKPMHRQHMRAMRKLRMLQGKKEFRDLVWSLAVERLDSRTPEILDGVADRAANGRVDAAKLALEVAGRYTPKGHDQPTAVQIVVNGVPRPMAISGGEVVDGEVVAEEDTA